jgi:putative peptidoglycan lipid II flippase
MTVARDERSGTARDSLVAGFGTVVSRLTGLLRVVMVGAVLGPTTFGDTFQLTNSLPNLIYYGFLAGSLFASLLVPALVRHVDRGDPSRTARVSGGFLGISWLAMLGLVPLAVVVVPPVMGLLAPGDPAAAAEQTDQARLLLLLMCPQVFLYAVAGASASVLNAHRRFALAAIAPAVENVAVIGVLAAVWFVYGPASGAQTSQPVAELVLLGLGSTGAVAAHAALQWVCARRLGVTVRPRAGWRDPEVMPVVRRAVRSVLQAGLLALQMLVVLLLAGRAAGGTVALQIVFNFYYLPIAVVATPVGLALIPRLSRLHQARQDEEFRSTFVEGLELALFFAVPAAVGYVLLAEPVAHAVGVGAMGSPAGVSLVAGSLAAIAVGLVGQTAFYISMQAAYARADTRTPLVAMGVQASVCVSLALMTLFLPGEEAVRFLGAAYAIGALVGGLHLTRAVGMESNLSVRTLVPLMRRLSVGALAMALPVVGLTTWLVAAVDGSTGWILALVLGSVVGALTFLAVQLAMRSPELSALRGAVRRRQVRDPVAEEPVR